MKNKIKLLFVDDEKIGVCDLPEEIRGYVAHDYVLNVKIVKYKKADIRCEQIDLIL